MAEFKLGRLKFVWKGEWATGATYVKDDIISFGGKSYVCVQGHVAASNFYTNISHWEVMNDGFQWKSAWTTTTEYKLNDVVKFGGGAYICTSPHTSASTFDETKWEIFIEGLEFSDSWDSAVEYQAGDIVAYGGYTFVALQRNTNKVPTQEAADWKPFVEGINARGTWQLPGSGNDPYSVGDLVQYGGNIYLCKQDATSQTPENSQYWALFAESLNWTGEWINSGRYKIGDLAKFNTSTWICITHHNSTDNTSPALDLSHTYWEAFADGSASAVVTTRGDIIYRDVTGPQRLPIGIEHQILAVGPNDEPVWSSTANIQAHSLTTTDNVEIDPLGVNGGVLAVGNGAALLRVDNNEWAGYVGLTDVSAVLVNDVDAFAQIALKNKNSGTHASTDLIAYTDNGDNDSGWIDIGITSSNFDITSGYGITDKHDGYIFMSAPVGSTGKGNLVVATSENGTEKDIIFVTGGFDPLVNTDAEKMRIIGEGRPGKPAGVEIYIDTQSTSSSTGALRVQGGIGLTGNLNTVGDVSSSGGVFYQGLGAKDLTVNDSRYPGYIGLTDTSGVFTGDADAFVQFALKNHSSGQSASTDLIAYASDGDNDSGWIDLGITSENYNDPDFTVTGPGTGYLFYSAPAGTVGTGDLLIGTDANGSNADIIFFTNGFDAGNERMAIIGVDRPGKQAGVEIYSTNDSTSTTTGALRVQGGIGLQGTMNVGGNVNIVGTITIGGAGSALETQTLHVSDPLIKLGTDNSADIVDLGLFGQYSSTTALLNGAITASDTTITVSSTTGFPTGTPNVGVVYIGTEEITYTGKTATTLTGCTRGANGTTAASHANGATIYVPTYTGLVRDVSDGGTYILFDGLNSVSPTSVISEAENYTYAPLKVGTFTTTGNVAINGTAVTSSSSSMDLFNTTVTTLNFAGGATTMTIGGSSTTSTFGGNVAITKELSVGRLTEVLANKTGATAVTVHDATSTDIWYHTSPAADFTPNFTNVPTTNKRTTVMTVIIEQGATARSCSAVQIEGVAQTIKWAGGVIPTTRANKVDVYSFTLIRQDASGSATWTVLGQLGSFG